MTMITHFLLLLNLHSFLVVAFRFDKLVIRNIVDLSAKDSFGKKLWQNEGFQTTDTEQIQKKHEFQINSASKMLMGTGAASLQTKLNNYQHNFLTIKFSSSIQPFRSHLKRTTKPESVYTLNPTTMTTLAITSMVHPPTTTLPITHPSYTTNPTVTKNVNKLSATSTNANKILTLQLKTVVEIHPKDDVAKELEEKEGEGKEENAGNFKTSERRKRHIEINSQEMLQIQQIIRKAQDSSLHSNSGNSSHNSSSVKTIVQVQTTDQTTVSPPSKQIVDTISGADAGDFKLSYKTWKASFDKIYRPPGLYVLVDDQVLFDNWAGIWHRPNTIGRSTPYYSKLIWNETEIQMRWEEPPTKDIKVSRKSKNYPTISFEWEPIDHNSFIIFDNIEISTLGLKEADQEAEETEDLKLDKKDEGGNTRYAQNTNKKNNMTFVVAVSPNAFHQPNGQSQHMLHEPEIVATTENNEGMILLKTFSENMKGADMNSIKDKGAKISENQTKNSGTSSTEIITKAYETSNNKGKTNSRKSDNTALIVLILVIVLSAFILATVVHNKLMESRPNKRGRGC